MEIKDGDNCPKTRKLVMLRSDLGCVKCKHKVRFTCTDTLKVECDYHEDKRKD